MNEKRKVPLNTLGPLKKDKDKAKEKKISPVKALRFSLELSETTDTSCPIFIYRDLLGTAMKKEKQLQNGLVGKSAFSDEEEDEEKLKEIAKKFEEKYGGGKHRLDNYDDLGDGYDESDSFIDNTEAIDELLPANLSPLHGGFYINCGKLQFRKVDPKATAEADYTRSAQRKKIRRISSSSSEENEANEEAKESGDEEKLENARETMLKSVVRDGENSVSSISSAKKKKLFLKRPHAGEEYRSIKKKKITEMLKKKKKKQTLSVREMLEKKRTNSSAENDKEGKPNGLSEEKKKEKEAAIDETIESVVKAAHNKTVITPTSMPPKNDTPESPPMTPPPVLKRETVAKSLSESESSSQSVSSESHSGEGEEIKPKPQSPDPIVALPEKLAPEILEIVEDLKGSETVSPEFQKILLRLEKAVKWMDVESRNQVFSHLGAMIQGCSAEGLMRLGIQLYKEENDRRLQLPLDRLKRAIETVMPDLVKKHAEECKAAMESAAGLEVGSGGDEESGGEGGGKEPRKKKMPRRKFEWTDEVRELFLDVMRIRVKMFEEETPVNVTAEEYLKEFLEIHIKPLWPKNWMNSRDLYKESRITHAHLTSRHKRTGTGRGRGSHSVRGSAHCALNTSPARVSSDENEQATTNTAATELLAVFSQEILRNMVSGDLLKSQQLAQEALKSVFGRTAAQEAEASKSSPPVPASIPAPIPPPPQLSPQVPVRSGTSSGHETTPETSPLKVSPYAGAGDASNAKVSPHKSPSHHIELNKPCPSSKITEQQPNLLSITPQQKLSCFEEVFRASALGEAITKTKAQPMADLLNMTHSQSSLPISSCNQTTVNSSTNILNASPRLGNTESFKAPSTISSHKQAPPQVSSTGNTYVTPHTMSTTYQTSSLSVNAKVMPVSAHSQVQRSQKVLPFIHHEKASRPAISPLSVQSASLDLSQHGQMRTQPAGKCSPKPLAEPQKQKAMDFSIKKSDSPSFPVLALDSELNFVGNALNVVVPKMSNEAHMSESRPSSSSSSSTVAVVQPMNACVTRTHAQSVNTPTADLLSQAVNSCIGTNWESSSGTVPTAKVTDAGHWQRWQQQTVKPDSSVTYPPKKAYMFDMSQLMEREVTNLMTEPSEGLAQRIPNNPTIHQSYNVTSGYQKHVHHSSGSETGNSSTYRTSSPFHLPSPRDGQPPSHGMLNRHSPSHATSTVLQRHQSDPGSANIPHNLYSSAYATSTFSYDQLVHSGQFQTGGRPVAGGVGRGRGRGDGGLHNQPHQHPGYFTFPQQSVQSQGDDRSRPSASYLHRGHPSQMQRHY